MTAPKFMHGPWWLTPGIDPYRVYASPEQLVAGQKGSATACIASMLTVGARTRRPAEELIANGHLIAAAPDLYAALEILVARCRCRGMGAWSWMPSDVELIEETCREDSCVAARSALAKARGES